MKRRLNDSTSRAGRNSWLYSSTITGRSSGPTMSTIASAMPYPFPTMIRSHSPLWAIERGNELLPGRDVERGHVGAVLVLFHGLRLRYLLFGCLVFPGGFGPTLGALRTAPRAPPSTRRLFRLLRSLLFRRRLAWALRFLSSSLPR